MVFHKSPIDHLKKLRRVMSRLESHEMHADDMDDFCKTAWHLIELVEKDTGATREMRRRASQLRRDPDLALCEHASNMAKHEKSRADEKVGLEATEIQQGWGTGRFGKGGYGVGEQSIVFVFKDSSKRDAFEFVASVLGKWEEVFKPELTKRSLI